MNEPIETELEVLSSIRRIIRAVDLHSRRLVEAYGLTGPQLITLREVARLGNASAGTIARAVNLSQPTVTGILDRLEKRELISRTRNGRDRRSVTVTVGPKGLSLLERAPSLLQERFKSEFRKLQQWEQTQVLATLQRVASMMHADEIPADPLLTTDTSTSPSDRPAIPATLADEMNEQARRVATATQPRRSDFPQAKSMDEATSA